MQMVINCCYGGFSLSEKAVEMLGAESPYEYNEESRRYNPKLVEVVETLGGDADGACASLEVVDIPDDATDLLISDYDGYETVYYVLNGKIHRA